MTKKRAGLEIDVRRAAAKGRRTGEKDKSVRNPAVTCPGEKNVPAEEPVVCRGGKRWRRGSTTGQRLRAGTALGETRAKKRKGDKGPRGPRPNRSGEGEGLSL